MFLLCVKNNFYGDGGICLIKKRGFCILYVERRSVLL